MSAKLLTLRKWTMLIHRWMGVGFCALFAAWFVSGIVMMYCPYPRVGPAERLLHAKLLDPERLVLTPEQAQKAASMPVTAQARIAMLDERPVYRLTSGRQHKAVYADDGSLVEPLPQATALRIASGWVQRSAHTAAVSGPVTEADQWTVPQATLAYGPFWKFSWREGDEVYVSMKTGEVAQHTTFGSRMGAWFGAIPHWIYFTPLRSQPPLWNQVVIWLSGAGTVMTVLGMIAGVWLYSPAKRYRLPSGRTSVPYAGQKRLHVWLGLAFGLVTCTWIFSGMMSMSPFPWLRDDPQRPNLEKALRGLSPTPSDFEALHPRAALTACKGRLQVKELELTSFSGAPTYLAWQSSTVSVVVPAAGQPFPQYSREAVLNVIEKADPSFRPVDTAWLTEYDAYYIDRHNRKPLPVLRIRFNDPEQSVYYVDPKTARVVQSYGSGSRWNRWLYHGLHSFDLPLLYKYRPAWDVLVLALMLGGSWLCVTSLVIGWQRIRRKARQFQVRKQTA